MAAAAPALLVMLLAAGQLAALSALPDAPRVEYDSGRGAIIGERRTSAGLTGPARDYAAFLGVPFAKPPTGPLRFEPPEKIALPSGTWRGNNTNMCLQFVRQPPQKKSYVLGEEDCLVLHVFTPNFDSPTLDVLVQIHGGGFMTGSGPTSGIDYLMDRDVVVVSVQYRLGILGFMTFEDDAMAGNLGMLDQVASLEWVRDNIGLFGGNKDSVTLVGDSAGSASCLLHTLSPRSQGLFHKVIAASGSPLNPWTQQHSARQNALRVAEYAKCTSDDSRAMVDCLRSRDGIDLVSPLGDNFQDWLRNPFSPFAPVVDTWSSKPFLPGRPEELLREGRAVADVPILMSRVTHEGLYTAAEFLADPELMTKLDKQWESASPGLLHFHDGRVSDAQRVDWARKIRQHYLNDASLGEAWPQLVQMMGDGNFGFGVSEHARLVVASKSSPVYFFTFAYRGEFSLSIGESGGNMTDIGVSHGDDFSYPTGIKLRRPDDIEMRKLFVNMWISFVSKGRPVLDGVAWDPVAKRHTDSSLNYLLISSPRDIKMVEDKDVAHSTFWKSLNSSAGGLSTSFTALLMAVVLALNGLDL